MRVLGRGRENSRASIFRCASGCPSSSHCYPRQPPTASQKPYERSICDTCKTASGMYIWRLLYLIVVPNVYLSPVWHQATGFEAHGQQYVRVSWVWIFSLLRTTPRCFNNVQGSRNLDSDTWAGREFAAWRKYAIISLWMHANAMHHERLCMVIPIPSSWTQTWQT